MTPDAVFAVRIAAQHGLPAVPIRALGVASVNHAFAVGQDQDHYVIRFAVDPLRGDEFTVEAWCSRLAAAHGIATPEVIAVGTLDQVPYTVQRFVPHGPRDAVPGHQRWHTIGRYARMINELPLAADAPAGLFARFGRDLPVAWQAHVAYGLAELTAEDPLLALGVYSAADRPRLQRLMTRLAETEVAFGLSHGDLASRNVLVQPDGTLVLIDWGSAACGPVPHTDLLVLLRDHERDGDPSTEDLAAFGAGYGCDLAELRPTLDAIRLVTALDLVRWALDHRPDQVAAYVSQARQELARTHHP